jgi:hypothetical protein
LGYFDYAGLFGLRYDNGTDTNFQFFVKGTSGNDVTVDTGIPADANFHTILVYSTVAGTFRMSLDGGTEKTFCPSGCDGTVSVPTAFMDPVAQITNTGATAEDLYLDAFKYKARISNSPTNRRN